MTRVVLELCQTSKMERFARIVNNIQPLILQKAFSILDVWLGSEYTSDDYIARLFFQKTFDPFSYTSFLYQHSIDFWITMTGNTLLRECKTIHIFTQTKHN